MIVFLYGSDSYRRDRKMRLLVAEYRKKHSGLSVDFFDVSEGALWDDVRGAVKNRSLFDVKKLVVFNVRGGEIFVKEEIKWLKALAADTEETLFIAADAAPLKSFAFLLTAPVHAQEFTELSGAELKVFVETEAKRRGLAMLPTALARLAAEYRGDVWGLMTEMDRLALSSVRDFISEKTTPDDFISAIKTIAYGSAGSLATLERMIAHEDPAKIFNVLASFTAGEKKRRMADYDAAIKFGLQDYESALTDFVVAS